MLILTPLGTSRLLKASIMDVENQSAYPVVCSCLWLHLHSPISWASPTADTFSACPLMYGIAEKWWPKQLIRKSLPSFVLSSDLEKRCRSFRNDKDWGCKRQKESYFIMLLCGFPLTDQHPRRGRAFWWVSLPFPTEQEETPTAEGRGLFCHLHSPTWQAWVSGCRKEVLLLSLTLNLSRRMGHQSYGN